MKRIYHVAVAIVAATVARQPAAAEPTFKPYVIERRDGTKVEGALGELRVPLLRSDPSRGSMTLRFVRLQSTGGNGLPIIYLAGGPGSSAVEAARGDRWPLFDHLRKAGDVILLEQRGVGLSDAPPKCSKQWSPPMEMTEHTVRQSIEQAARGCAAEWSKAGVVLDAYNVEESVADVVDLISALHAPKAKIVGISYGTFLGLALLRDHPHLIDRAVLAGVEGPDDTLKLPRDADRDLAALSRYLSAQSDGKFDLETSVRKLFARLGRGPIKLEAQGKEDRIVTLYGAQVAIFFLLGSSNNWQKLQDVMTAANAGNLAPLHQLILYIANFYGALPAMPLATDAVSPSSASRVRKIARTSSRSLFGSAVNFPNADFAAALGLKPLPARFYSPVKSDVPTLFISGTLDARTPYWQADQVRRLFATNGHLIIEGAGHDNDLFLSTPLIIDRIDHFLAGEKPIDERISATAIE